MGFNGFRARTRGNGEGVSLEGEMGDAGGELEQEPGCGRAGVGFAGGANLVSVGCNYAVN